MYPLSFWWCVYPCHGIGHDPYVHSMGDHNCVLTVIMVLLIVRSIIIMVFMVKSPWATFLIVLMGTLFGLQFFGCLFAVNDSLVLTIADVIAMTALKEFFKIKNIIFNNAVYLHIFDSMSFGWTKKTCLHSAELLGNSKQWWRHPWHSSRSESIRWVILQTSCALFDLKMKPVNDLVAKVGELAMASR